MTIEQAFETDLDVGPSAIGAYSRLNYTMWYALAEFIDNSTQSRLNHGSIIDDVLAMEGSPLVVTITHNRPQRQLVIEDNSIGMTGDDLKEGLRIAHPTKDSKGRSKYGMGMKTAACWIGSKWKVVTAEWDSGKEWTAVVDVDAVAKGAKIQVTPRTVGKEVHYTKIVISDLHRNIQARTEETIRWYLGSMYRHDLQEGKLKIVYNGEDIPALEDMKFDTDPKGNPMQRSLPELKLGGKIVRGWVGVLRKGAGGRKYGGFSLFQNRRQIQGFPNAWKPKSIYGGVDDEGANNLISQRLTGVLELEGFEVSHTKDMVDFQSNEEEELEKWLYEQTKDYKDYAAKRRGTDGAGNPWSKDKIRDMLNSMEKEFSSPEMKDAVVNAPLPPYETIVANNKKMADSLKPDDLLKTFQVLPELKVSVTVQENSEHDPHLTIVAGAQAGQIHVIINGLHPYYTSLEATDSMEECIRQYLYDAISEYRVSKQYAQVNPDSVRRAKNDLLRVQSVQIENAAAAIQSKEFQTIIGGKPPSGGGK